MPIRPHPQHEEYYNTKALSTLVSDANYKKIVGLETNVKALVKELNGKLQYQDRFQMYNWSNWNRRDVYEDIAQIHGFMDSIVEILDKQHQHNRTQIILYEPSSMVNVYRHH